MTSREAAALVYGERVVAHYELVKTFYTRYGLALERTYCVAVGGRLGIRGRRGVQGEPDVITPLGAFEFCASANTKNAAGNHRDRRSGVVVVQIAERTVRGRISGEEFLRRHGIAEPERVAERCQIEAMWDAAGRGIQLRIDA